MMPRAGLTALSVLGTVKAAQMLASPYWVLEYSSLRLTPVWRKVISALPAAMATALCAVAVRSSAGLGF